MSSSSPFWDFPHRSIRRPVLADNVVATTQPVAAQAGLKMLQAGGNAMDAALASAIALTVVEPVMNGIGGDAFAIVWDGQALHGLNASGRAPAAWTPEYFSQHDKMPEVGWDTVTVPGQVAGWFDLSKRFGRLPFADLFEPAIRYATKGFHVMPVISRIWAQQVELLKDQPGFAEAFLIDGKPPEMGTRWKFPDQAWALERIAQTNGRDFYEGELADRMIAFARETGGALRHQDLAQHVNEWVKPISMPYRDGYTLHEIPPNGQGIAALMGLGMLTHFDPPRARDDATGLFHLPIEAMKLAFADLAAYVGELDTMGSLADQLLDPDYLRSRAALINPNGVIDAAPGVPGNSGTIYLAAADEEGMVVSFIQSNYKGFGAGVVVPGTGIALHNRGTDFTLEPGHPNQVGPGKRPLNTIIPGFLTQHGKPVAGFGVMGGNMQAQGHVQVVQQLVDLQCNAQAAIDAPRFRIQPGPEIWLEADVPPGVVSRLTELGHNVRVQPANSIDFGASQIVQLHAAGGYVAASDPRRDGSAVGY